MELLLARNPDESSSLPYLLRLPLDGGLVFRTRGTWPRTSALYCHPIGTEEWPAEPEIVERVALRVCARRGAAIDVVCDRGREARSQIVFTRARGREVVFWQSPRTRKQSRPDVRVPTARAHGIEAMEIIVDAHERYPFRFANQQVRTVRRGLVCGDYAITRDERIVCAVERKSLDDLISSLSSGRLRFALSELSGLPRAAVVVEQGYAGIFAQQRLPGATVADGLAELQVRYPNVPIVHCDSRKLAEEWTYRFLGAAHAWARDEPAAQARIGPVDPSKSSLHAGPDGGRAIIECMSDDNEGFESGLRWLAQQVERSVEHLEEMDLDQIARAAGVDVDRAREFLDGAGQWLNSQAEGLIGEAGLRFGGFGGTAPGRDVVHGHDVGRREGPHPLDIPTAEQGLALSALDSGRWTVKPGSHLLVAHGEGPVPDDAIGLVGELRARDWINAEGEVTLVGHNALRRWMGHGDVA